MGNEQSSALDICSHESSDRVKLVKRRYDIDSRPVQAIRIEPRHSQLRGVEKPQEQDPLLKTFNTAFRHEPAKTDENSTSGAQPERSSKIVSRNVYDLDKYADRKTVKASNPVETRTARPTNSAPAHTFQSGTTRTPAYTPTISASARNAQSSMARTPVYTPTPAFSSPSESEIVKAEKYTPEFLEQMRSSYVPYPTAENQGAYIPDSATTIRTEQMRSSYVPSPTADNQGAYIPDSATTNIRTVASRMEDPVKLSTTPEEPIDDVPRRRTLTPAPANVRAAPPPPPVADSAPREAAPTYGAPQGVLHAHPAVARAASPQHAASPRNSLPPTIQEGSSPITASPSHSRGSSAAPISPAARTVSRSNPQILADKLAKARGSSASPMLRPGGSASPMMQSLSPMISPKSSPMMSPENSLTPEAQRTSVTQIWSNPAVMNPPTMVPTSKYQSSPQLVAAPQPMMMHAFPPSPSPQGPGALLSPIMGPLMPGLMIAM